MLSFPLVNSDLYSLVSIIGGVTCNENSNSLGGPEQLTTVSGSQRAQIGTVNFQLDAGAYVSLFTQHDCRVYPRVHVEPAVRYDLRFPPTDPQNGKLAFVPGTFKLSVVCQSVLTLNEMNAGIGGFA